MVKKYYLIITEPVNTKPVSDNAKTLGEIRFLLTTAFVLTMNHEIKLSEIRATISGEKKLRCIVVGLDSYINSAWSLSKDSSDYLKTIFAEIYEQEENAE